jgi:hypothetical protein
VTSQIAYQVQSAGNQLVISAQGQYLAEHIPGAQYLELPRAGHWPWAAPDADRFLDKLEEFLTGAPQAPGRHRVLATIAFADIVDSTAMAASMGDRRWREVLEVHDSVARREVAAARGRTVKSTGDGLLATFDGPARAIRCVGAIQHGVATLGLHTGEMELLGDDVGGIAVAIASGPPTWRGPVGCWARRDASGGPVDILLALEGQGFPGARRQPPAWVVRGSPARATPGLPAQQRPVRPPRCS